MIEDIVSDCEETRASQKICGVKLKTPHFSHLYGKKTQIRSLALQQILPQEIARQLDVPCQEVIVYLAAIKNHMKKPALKRLALAGASNSVIATKTGLSRPEVVMHIRQYGVYDFWKKKNLERKKEEYPLFHAPPETLDRYASQIIVDKLHRYHSSNDSFGVPNYHLIGEMAYLFYVYDLLAQRQQHTFKRIREITGLDKNKIMRYCERSQRPLLPMRRGKTARERDIALQSPPL